MISYRIFIWYSQTSNQTPCWLQARTSQSSCRKRDVATLRHEIWERPAAQYEMFPENRFGIVTDSLGNDSVVLGKVCFSSRILLEQNVLHRNIEFA